jgi:hypothetical protein
MPVSRILTQVTAQCPQGLDALLCGQTSAD